MVTCPQCGRKQADSADKCEGCSYNFLASRKTVVMDKPVEPLKKKEKKATPARRKKPKKPFYKKPVLIISAFLVLSLLIALGVFLYLNNLRQTSYEKSVENIWDDVITSSNSLKDSLAKTKDEDDFSQLADEASSQVSTLKDKLVDAKALKVPTAHQKTQRNLEEAFQKYIDYLVSTQPVLEEPLEVEVDVDFVELSSLASEAKIACQEVVDSIDFIEDDVPVKVFNMPQILRPIVKEAQQKEQTKKQEEAERQKQEQEEAEEQAAKAAVSGWMKALKDEDTQAMSNYMTTEAYEEINPETFEGDYTVDDYKITQATKVNSTKFEVKATEYNLWSSGEKTTTTRLFTVVKIGSKWLIDDQHTLY